jgi:hypothetical protein
MYKYRAGWDKWWKPGLVRKIDLSLCFLVTCAFMTAIPMLADPAMLWLPWKPVTIPWWIIPIGMGFFSFNHWLVAIGLGSRVYRCAWAFLCIVGVLGFSGFFWKMIVVQHTFMNVMPLVMATVMGLHLGPHYVYDRGSHRLSDPLVRATIGKAIFGR